MTQIFLNTIAWFYLWSLQDVQMLFDIFQSITVIAATIFTAWWAYSTFGYKEKTEELTAIARKVVEIHSHINRSVSVYDTYSILVSLGTYDAEKVQRLKNDAEIRLKVLQEELEELQSLSLNVPAHFRILRLMEYQLEMFNLGGVNDWRKDDMQRKLIDSKLRLLHDVELEINAHRKFFRRIHIKSQDAIYSVKSLFSSQGKR